MKKEELTALGITDEQAAKVLEMHGKEQNEAAMSCRCRPSPEQR